MPDNTQNKNALSVLLIGCGNMGGAILRGWINTPQISNITVLDPSALAPDLRSCAKITHFQNAGDAKNAINAVNIIIMAVKPQIMDDVCQSIYPNLPNKTPIISIAAGKTCAYFENRFGLDRPIIRVMPNLPAQIGKGISVLYANKAATELQKEWAQILFLPCGGVQWLADETLMDAVTALSGSGPAYLFHLIETLAASGTGQGLPKDLAMTLARQTIIGSASMVENASDTPARTLRENVTSPGGTTQAALDILMNGDLQKIYDQAIKAASSRSKELSA